MLNLIQVQTQNIAEGMYKWFPQQIQNYRKIQVWLVSRPFVK